MAYSTFSSLPTTRDAAPPGSAAHGALATTKPIDRDPVHCGPERELGFTVRNIGARDMMIRPKLRSLEQTEDYRHAIELPATPDEPLLGKRQDR
jgi:hypothetical protein